MNFTLTSLGILLVLALATALVGPFLVDWNAYRADFEAQAEARLGVPVSIGGDIDARILPMPYVRLNDVTVGADGASRLQVRQLQLRMGLTPLLRGQFEFNDVGMTAPRLALELDEHGRPVWAGKPAGIDPDTVVVHRVEVSDGVVDVTDRATGLRQHAENIRVTGEASSLHGPFKLDGTADVDGASYAVQVNTGRLDSNGGLRAKLEIEAVGRPLLIRADGTLQTGGERARYVGALVVQKPLPPAVRAAQAGAATGVAPPADAAAAATWRMEGRVAADMRQVAMELFDFQYGPDERALKLTGSATVALGAEPRFEASVAARQLDFDRAFKREDEQSISAEQVFARLQEILPTDAVASMPGRIALDVQGAVVGGDIVADTHAVADVDPGGWTIREGRARLPGSTALGLSGRVVHQPEAGFAGRVETRVGELAGLLHWLDGNEGARERTAIRSLSASGEVTASARTVSIEKLSLQADRAAADGRLRWTVAETDGRAGLEAELAARELRLDQAALSALAHLSGAAGTGAESMLAKTDLSLKLSAGVLQLGEFEAGDLFADLDASTRAVDIRALSFRAPGAARVSARGLLPLDPSAKDGRLEGQIAGGRLTEMVRTAQRVFGPVPALQVLADRAEVLSPADVRFTVAREADAFEGGVTGTLGGSALQLSGTLGVAGSGAVHGKGSLGNRDGTRLLTQLGLPVAAGTNAGEASLSFELDGADTGNMRLSLQGSAGDIEASGAGNIGLAGQDLDNANLGFTVTSPNLGRVLALLDRAPLGAAPLPVQLSGELFYGRGRLSLVNLDGKIGPDAVRGRIDLGGADHTQATGQLAFDRLSGGALASLAFGPAALQPGESRAGVASAWPTSPLARPPLAGLTGALAITAGRFGLPAGLEARDVSFELGLRREGVTIGNFRGGFARGRLTGTASLLNDGGNGTFSAIGRVADASLSEIFPLYGTRPLATGSFGLSVDVQTSGRSLSAMAAALGGGGTFNVGSAALQGLDPTAFAKAVTAMENGADVSAPRLAARMQADMFAAPLNVRSIEGAFTIAAGNLRASGLSADAPGASLTGELSLDIANAGLDAGIMLAPAPQPGAPAIPAVGIHLEGPLAAPKRTLDVTAFANLLGMRAVEIETRRIEQMEADIHERRMLNQRLRMIQVEKRWAAEKKAEEERRVAAAKAEEEQRAAEARAADEERRRQEQARIDEERARRLREAAPVPQAAPAAREDLPPLPTPIIVAPPPGARRSSLNTPPAPSGQPLNLMEYLNGTPPPPN